MPARHSRYLAHRARCRVGAAAIQHAARARHLSRGAAFRGWTASPEELSRARPRTLSLPAIHLGHSGQDISAHDESLPKLVGVIRGWLGTQQAGKRLPGGAAILRRFESFQAQLPEICAKIPL